MNTRKQLTSLACLAIAVSAVAAGCESDDNDNGGEGGTAGENGYGGMRTTGGAWGIAGSRPTGGAATTATHAGTGGTGATTTSGTNAAGAGGMVVIISGGSGPLATGGTGTGTSTTGGTGTGTTGTSTNGGTGISTTGGTGTVVTGGSTSVAGSTAAAGRGGVGAGTTAVAGNAGTAGASGVQHPMSFFVTSDTNTTGDLGGLVGADARCEALAATVGQGAGVWHAYLSAEASPATSNVAINARDRIGNGPWYNANGLLLANNLIELHSMPGDPDLFVDEHGLRINGQWAGSPTPVEHDVLTGSTANGAVMVGYTCAGWTSSSPNLTAQVGHTDGLGPGMSSAPPYDSWNSSHANQSCADTAPMGGAGRLYCFRVD